jgi:hypothetical protein
MTTDFTQAESKLTLWLDEEFSVPNFKLDEVINGRMTPSPTHLLKLTICNEQPDSLLNQALYQAINDKTTVPLRLTSNDDGSDIRDLNVVVNQPESPNVYRLSVIGPSNRQVVQGVPQR